MHQCMSFVATSDIFVRSLLSSHEDHDHEVWESGSKRDGTTTGRLVLRGRLGPTARLRTFGRSWDQAPLCIAGTRYIHQYMKKAVA